MGRSVLEIIVQAVKRGTGIEAAAASLKLLSGAAQGVNSVLGQFGLSIGPKQVVDFANATREAARAQADAMGALKAASSGIANYQEALDLGRQATKGMASDQQIAASQATLFGAGLAKSAGEAAQLSSAGTVLSQVFASAGASEDLYVRLLSSGSVALYNNFGLTAQMVEAKQREIEATRGLSGEEAKQQALKEVLIAQAQKYQSALSEESVAAAQAKAAQENFMAAFGNLVNALDQATGATSEMTSIMNKMTEGAKAWQGILSDAIPTIYEYATSTDEQWAAAQKAEAATRQWVSSAREMDMAASSAASSVRDLAAAQSDQQSVGLTNRETDAYRQMAEARGQTVEIQANFEKQQAREAEQEKRQEIQETTRQFKTQAQSITKAFDQVGQQISSAVSGAISQNGNDVISKLLGLDNAEQNAGEAVRRMAAVAAGGIKDQWADDLAAQLTGVQNATAQAFVKAFQTGDEGGLKAAAQQLALNPIVEMFDANLIANQIEQQLRAQQLQQQLNDKVNALLGERGLQAVTNVTQQIAGVAADTGAATTAVGESVTGLGASAQESGAKIGASFTAAIAPVDTLNIRLKLMAGLIERVNTLAGQASGNIAVMNPPAAPGGATDAQNKMGGNAPL